MDSLALNYNPLAIVEDESCVYDEPENGCTDEDALNYNPYAIFDNGICLYRSDFNVPIDDPSEGGDTNNDGVAENPQP
ncbi:hypothetical protein, partial [Escherichia coli]|uniref:hypothetical protein n=1 Tax=Escherichia coli TaxID=562 RepID=UPI003862A94C